MPKYRWIRNCQVLLIATVVFLAAGLVCGVLWLNERGFEGEWGKRIATELADHGLHADFQSVRFSPFRGIIAREVTIYSDASRQRIFARIPHLRFEVDRTRALRGDLAIRSIIMRDADVRVPVSSDGTLTLLLRNLSGRARLDRQSRFTLEDATATLGEFASDLQAVSSALAGIQINLDVELDEFDLSRLTTGDDESGDASQDEFVASLLKELLHWNFPPDLSPTLDLTVAGSMRRPKSIRTSFALAAPELELRNYTMLGVRLSGEHQGRSITVDHLEFSDRHGTLTANADYDLQDQAGRFELTSTIMISEFLEKALEEDVMEEVASREAPSIKGSGRFEDGQEYGVIGKLKMPAFEFRGVPFQHLETNFSWQVDESLQSSGLYLRDLKARHRDGELLTAQILAKGDSIQFEANSSLPFSAYELFTESGSGLAKMLPNAEFSPRSKVTLVVEEGTLRRSDFREWDVRGQATFNEIVYADVPLKRASAKIHINPLQSVFSDVEVDFDYTDYVMMHRHGGVASARVDVDRISYDSEDDLIRIKNLHGVAWPGPLLNLFARDAATHIENNYGFHHPPALISNGVINGGTSKQTTDVSTDVKTSGVTDYKFLGKTLQLLDLEAVVQTRPRRHDVTQLKFRTFAGAGSGFVTVRTAPNQPAAYNGELMFTDLSLRDLGQKYQFGEAQRGQLTGRINFRGRDGEPRSLNGDGLVGLRNGDLFFVPVFGPLSAPIASVLGNRRIGHLDASDASATFAIKNGVTFTQDFQAMAPSTLFTGEGRVDLVTKRLDMTVRMNARGLLGLVTLPLRPFNGLFQFRGQGPLENPVWRSSPFTQPARGPNDPIFRDPPRAQIVRER